MGLFSKQLKRLIHFVPKLRRKAAIKAFKEGKGNARYKEASKEFSNYLKQNNFNIYEFFRARKKLLTAKPNETKITHGRITLTTINGGNIKNQAYFATLGKKTFFVKEQLQKAVQNPRFCPEWDLASPQETALKQAQKLLKNNPQVKIAQWHYSFVSKNRSILVTEAYEGIRVDYALGEIQLQNLNHLKQAITCLKTAGFGDVVYSNVIYQPKTQTFVIFDLRLP